MTATLRLASIVADIHVGADALVETHHGDVVHGPRVLLRLYGGGASGRDVDCLSLAFASPGVAETVARALLKEALNAPMPPRAADEATLDLEGTS